MKVRDAILDMRSSEIELGNCGWSIKFDTRTIPIPTEIKKAFKEAIEKALDQIEQEIDKL